MKLWQNILIQGFLWIGNLIFEKYQHRTVKELSDEGSMAILFVSFAVSIAAHFYNPDGSIAETPWRKK